MFHVKHFLYKKYGSASNILTQNYYYLIKYKVFGRLLTDIG